MIKKLTLTAVLILICNMSYAANFRSVHTVKSSTNDTVFLVGSTSTVYTRSFTLKDVKNDNDIGVLYKATSDGGTVELDLHFEQSFQPPTTEGAADATYLDSETIASAISDTVWHLATIDTVVLPYGRFSVRGTGSNDANTTFEIKVAK